MIPPMKDLVKSKERTDLELQVIQYERFCPSCAIHAPATWARTKKYQETILMTLGTSDRLNALDAATATAHDTA
jgi:hypothetical protein